MRKVFVNTENFIVVLSKLLNQNITASTYSNCVDGPKLKL